MAMTVRKGVEGGIKVVAVVLRLGQVLCKEALRVK